MKVKVTIDTTVSQVETANVLLAAAVNELFEDSDKRRLFGLTLAQVRAASKFRESLIASFLNNPKPSDHGVRG